jgi:Mn2+/Fe2+ NRAMP family transporter
MAVESNSGKDTQYGSLPSSVEEDDPQEEYQTTADFFVAIGFVAFGIVALASGLLSIYWSMTGYN